MATFLGRQAKIYVGTSSPGTTAVESHFDAAFDRTPQKADLTSNDSGAFDEHAIVRYSGDLSFKMYTSPSATGQNILRTAGGGATPTQIYVDVAEEGNASGKKYLRFLASVTLKRGTPRDGNAVTDVTLSPTGTVTEGTY